jgi:hypothetical protein
MEVIVDLAHLGVSGGRRKALIVLGAGASRGASFAADPTSVLPPLDADFFQQLSRMRQTDESRRLLRFVREEFGSEVGLSMEEFFSQADYTDRFHSELNVDPGPHVRKYAAALEDFMVLLPRVLHASIGHHVCSHHAQLARALRAADCVITYNYDCIMDRALWRSWQDRLPEGCHHPTDMVQGPRGRTVRECVEGCEEGDPHL